jgi:uncharacterized membrane protein
VAKKKRFIRLPKKEYRRGDTVPVSAIYECSECDNITAFKKGEEFGICDSCRTEDDAQRWERTNELLHFVTKNLNDEFERVESWGLKTADFLGAFSGTITFVVMHLLWFWFWIHSNLTGKFLGYAVRPFDPYPFGLLTMIVSLEAIILSAFILISQNRQGAKSELRAELDYQVNLQTEKDVAEVLSILRELREQEQQVNRKTTEILEDTEAITKQRQKGRKRKPKRGAEKIIEDAGIDRVEGSGE